VNAVIAAHPRLLIAAALVLAAPAPVAAQAAGAHTTGAPTAGAQEASAHQSVSAGTVMVSAERVFTGSTRGELGPSVIVIRDGRIVAIVAEGDVVPDVPAEALRLSAAVVIPGLVDARTTAGLAGMHPADDDADEAGAVRPDLRAVDAFDLREPLLRHALRSGVTVVQAGPGDAASIGGEAGIFRTHAPTVDVATLTPRSAMVISLSRAAKEASSGFPTTRMGNVALIRQAFLDAAHHAAQDNGRTTPGHDAMARVLAGDVPALVVADRSDEIAAALRLQDEFGIRAAIAGAREADAVIELLAGRGVPVLLVHPRRESAARERTSSAAGVAVRLAAAGIPFALATGGFGDERTLLEWAVEVAREGLSPEETLAAVTLTPARLLGVDDRVGSLEPGKDADLVLLDGDPFGGLSRVEAVLVRGEVAHGGSR
jgi:imidazolonepropionase-like amidohydrolase